VAKTPFSVKKFLWLFSAWWCTWAGVQAWMLYGFGYTATSALTDSFMSNVSLAFSCVLIAHILQYYVPNRERYWYISVISILIAILWAISIFYTLPYFISQAGYPEFLSKSLPIRFGIAFLLLACMAMISVVWYTFEEQKIAEKRKTEIQQLSKEAELYKLRQQLQPHFLFNSLNSINALIGTQPKQARKMIQQLSDFLRGTLKKEDNQFIPLREELQQLQLYLDIEMVRFGNRLKTHFAIEEETLKMQLPAMLLQPIVENAIKFGLYDTLGETCITISAQKDNGYLLLHVKNPFDPATTGIHTGTGFGLHSIERRLYLLFARNDLLQTQQEATTFITTLKIPH
jgi:sensor histidine kinase YesM